MRCHWSVAVSLAMAPAVHQGCAHGFVVDLFVYKSWVQPIGYRKARDGLGISRDEGRPETSLTRR